VGPAIFGAEGASVGTVAALGGNRIPLSLRLDDTTGLPTSENLTIGGPDDNVFFANADCTGAAYLQTMRAGSSVPSAFIIVGTGSVLFYFAENRTTAQVVTNSYQLSNDGTCNAYTSAPQNLYQVDQPPTPAPWTFPLHVVP
jgi:hypothetical protein